MATKKRNGGVSEAMVAYAAANPRAQYFEALTYLHSCGYRVNRHGSAELLGAWKRAQAEAKSRRA